MSTNIDEANPQAGMQWRGTVSAIAGWLGMLLLAATVVYFAVTADSGWPTRILAIAAMIAITAYIWLNPETIAAVVTGQGTRTFLTTTIIVVLGIALVVAINWLYGLLAPRISGEFGRIDMTAGQSLTLADQSIRVMRDLPSATTAIGFFREDDTGLSSRRTAENLLKEYTKYNPELRVEWVNPDIDPVRATQYGLTRVNVVVFDNGTKHETATSITETEFTGALLRLRSTVVKTVAVLNTPSLVSFSGSSGDAVSASLAQSGLTAENYKLLPAINVVVSPTISVNDVTVLIVPPAPTTEPINDAAVRMIVDYLDKGGHVLLIGDPLAAPLPTAILTKYGITESRSLIVEQDQNNTWGNSPLNLAIFNYGTSTVTRDMEGQPTIFRATGILQPPTSTITGFLTTEIIQSGQLSLGAQLVTQDVGGQQQGGLQPDPNFTAGPLSLALSVEQQVAASTTDTNTTAPNATRLIVVDDYDWLTDELMNQPVANRDLFNNMVNWLSQSEERISVRPTDTTDRSLFLSNEQKSLIAWSTIVFLPLLALFGGGIVWWRRR